MVAGNRSQTREPASDSVPGSATVAVESPLQYPIYVADGLLDAVGELAARHAPAHNYAIVTDENVGPLYAARVRKSFGEGRVHTFTMPAGENAKSVTSWWDLS